MFSHRSYNSKLSNGFNSLHIELQFTVERHNNKIINFLYDTNTTNMETYELIGVKKRDGREAISITTRLFPKHIKKLYLLAIQLSDPELQKTKTD